jgi:hypothetical protein
MNEQLSNTLSQLAAKLGVSVETLWPMLIQREQRLSFTLSIFFAAICMGLVVTLTKKYITLSSSETCALKWSITGMLVVCVIMLICCIFDAIYPEASVVLQLLRA